jgi:DNA-binding response OmpR family regulator
VNAASSTAPDLARVLIVEDDAVIRDVLARAFETFGTEVIQRSDALEVRALLSGNGRVIDILVMDIDLPHMTGLECLDELRDAGIDTPCVLITGGLTDAPANVRHVRLLRKPFPIETLEATCRALLAEHRSDKAS